MYYRVTWIHFSVILIFLKKNKAQSVPETLKLWVTQIDKPLREIIFMQGIGFFNFFFFNQSVAHPF